MQSLDRSIETLLMCGVLPLWAAAGFGDWLCHRMQRLELTAGWPEALLHAAMLAVLAPATVAVLLLEVTAPVLVWLLCACVVHELLFWCDLAYASRRRVIGPAEQWIHCVQFAMPWAGLVALALLHRDQVAALIGATGAPAADWSWRTKDLPLSSAYVLSAIAACSLLVGWPFAEELWRCWRARQTRLHNEQAASAEASRLPGQVDGGRGGRRFFNHRMEFDMANETKLGAPNRDPITGAPGAHPVGTGLGAAIGGAAAGAAAGTVAGPAGSLAGAAVGAVLGGWAGKVVAEQVDPTAEEAYWRDNYQARPYAAEGRYEDYGPAYRYGVNAYRSFPNRSFDAMEPELSRHWPDSSEGSTLDWDRARHATRDAWERLSNSVERAIPGDSDKDGR